MAIDPVTGAMIVKGATALGSTAMGITANKWADNRESDKYNRNLKGSKELMGIQNNYQRGLNVQGHNLQYDMWKKTNYPAQIEMMKEAGLNPALMYGQAGAGGQTGSQGGGSAASGQAPQQYQPMDMSNLMMGAQIANLNANTKKTEAEAENEAGGVRKNLKAEYRRIMAEADWKEQVKKTEVNKTESAKYQKLLDEMNVEWGTKYKLTPQDSAAVKTLLRTKGILADNIDVNIDQETKEAIEIIVDESEQKRLSEIKGIGGESQRD